MPEKLKNIPQKWAAIPALIAAVALLSAFFGGGSSTPETIYRENTVVRGDITVGVSETATATLKSHALTFDIGGTVEEVFVKAGQKVQTGDVLATIDASSIMEQLSDIRAEYQEALYELNDAQLAKQKGEIDAYNTYQNTLLASQFADDTYEVTLNKLKRAVTTAETNLYNAQTEVRTLNRLLKYVDYYDDASMYYDDAKSWYEYAKTYLSDCTYAMEAYQKDQRENPTWNPVDDEDYQELVRLYELAKEDLAYAKLEYEDAAEDYDEKYDKDYPDEASIKEARVDAYKKLTEAEDSLKEAEYNLAMQTLQAGQTKENSQKKADMAQTTYEMELRKLESNITSKQQLVDNKLEQVNKYTGYLENCVIVAPCNGTVTSANFSGGDEFQSNNTLFTVSDSDNVSVYMSVTQDDVINITLGQPCTVNLDAFESIAFQATVDAITTSPMRSSSGSANYNVSILLAGDTSQVFEGMTGSATIVTKQIVDVLQVSYRSVYKGSDGGSYVKVKDAAGNIAETAVETGFSDGRNVEIISGLEEGDIVIIESQVSGL